MMRALSRPEVTDWVKRFKAPKTYTGSIDLTFGQALVFYSVTNEKHCQAGLLLDVDPLGLCAATTTGAPGPWCQAIGRFEGIRAGRRSFGAIRAGRTTPAGS
jgi:RNA repair, ligase-Pnkp-associating, region of Hen1